MPRITLTITEDTLTAWTVAAEAEETNLASYIKRRVWGLSTQVPIRQTGSDTQNVTVNHTEETLEADQPSQDVTPKHSLLSRLSGKP